MIHEIYEQYNEFEEYLMILIYQEQYILNCDLPIRSAIIMIIIVIIFPRR